ncbi:hypothetical protein F2Q69_00028859 [Brassica cretica]|uniref:Uncharacterized protein n=1 Tax=Brassica cretica TaxID=69181 RepID=A0A8S9S7R3_BRACR|nr:hypothetical protein F2Q69_00028859 [Brassica cretica]
MAPLPLSCVYAAPSLVGPASSVGEGELVEWQSRYSLPSSVILRVPILEERASSYIPGEIAVYEAFFDSGLRGTIPVLIVGHVRISSSSSYGGEGQFHLRPRSGLPIMEELPKSDRKGLPELIMLLRKERESCSLSTTASCGSSPGELLGDMSGGVTNDPFAAYQEAVKVMSAKKGSSSRSASGDEVMITGSRRSTVVKLEPSTSLPGKRPKSGSVTTRLAQQLADMARSAGSLDVALSNLNLNVFPQDGTVFPIGDPSEVVQVLQGGLLPVSSTACPCFVQIVSQLYHLGERLSSEDLPTLREEIEDLKRQVSGERDQLAARELEVCNLKDKVKDLEKVAETSSADALTTSQKNQELGEEIDALKSAVETFKFEMVMAVNGVRVVARWELMREWLRKHSAQWDLVTALEQYKAVVREEAVGTGIHIVEIC